MSVKTTIVIDDEEINVLWFNYAFNQRADGTGRPSNAPVFLGLQLAIETRKTLNLAHWSFSPTQTKEIELHISPIIIGGRTRTIKFYDCHLLKWDNHFSATGSAPMHEVLHISAAGIKDSNSSAEYSAYWRKTFDYDEAEPTVIEQEEPRILHAKWLDENGEEVTETIYGEQVSLIAQIENHESSSAKIIITKEDGTEFENGKTELTFDESIDDDGMVELTSLEIKKQWEEFKTADVDKLIAKVEHQGTSKNSKALKIAPPSKVLVNFRTGNGYKGEYGFDWIRMGDTGKKGDIFYKNIIGNYKAKTFVQSDAEYTKLGREFEMPNHPIKPKDKYVVPVLTLLPKKKATLTLKVEIEGSDAKKIEYIYDNNLLTLNKTEISYKTVGKKELADELTITAKEFSKDQTIKVLADKKFAGKIKILANDKAHRYKADIVFVEVETFLKGSKTKAHNFGKAKGRKSEFTKYFNQALANAKYDTVSIDLSSDTLFNTNYSSGGNIIKGTSDAIQDHLNATLYGDFDPLGKDYRKHYKVYFINEKFGGTYGRAYGIPSTNRSVVIFALGFADSTVAHETLHAMGLYHPFNGKPKFFFDRSKTDNIMDYSDIEATPPIPVISTWHWQWNTLWNNLDKE